MRVTVWPHILCGTTVPGTDQPQFDDDLLSVKLTAPSWACSTYGRETWHQHWGCCTAVHCHSVPGWQYSCTANTCACQPHDTFVCRGVAWEACRRGWRSHVAALLTLCHSAAVCLVATICHACAGSSGRPSWTWPGTLRMQVRQAAAAHPVQCQASGVYLLGQCGSKLAVTWQ